jgi:predicted aspartyl protease
MKQLIIVAGVALAAVSLAAAERKVSRKDLPAAVEQAVAAEESKGAKVVGLSRETEGGKTFYEIETTVNGRTRDLLVTPTGVVVEVEEAVAVDAVPAAARRALMARGTVVSVESVTKNGVVTYEARVKRNGKTSAVRCAPMAHL